LRRVATGHPDAPEPHLVSLVRALDAPPLDRLDLDILNRLARGETHQAIAAALVTSESTLQRHIRRLLLRLDANSGQHLAAVAVAKGLAWPWEAEQ